MPGQKNAFGSPLGIDYVDYTLTIKVKEGKYKIILSDFSERGGIYDYSQTYGSLDQDEVQNPFFGAKKFAKKYWISTKKTAQSKSEYLLSSFRATMKKKSDNDF